jgi:hypothetical protein
VSPAGIPGSGGRTEGEPHAINRDLALIPIVDWWRTVTLDTAGAALTRIEVVPAAVIIARPGGVERLDLGRPDPRPGPTAKAGDCLTALEGARLHAQLLSSVACGPPPAIVVRRVLLRTADLFATDSAAIIGAIRVDADGVRWRPGAGA